MRLALVPTIYLESRMYYYGIPKGFLIYRSWQITASTSETETLAVFTRDTFTRGKLTFLWYCVTFCYCEMHLPHVNVSRVNTAVPFQHQKHRPKGRAVL